MGKKKHGSRIGKYTITGVLGHGGMGSVYKVIHPETGKNIALKLLNPSGPLTELLEDEKLRAIFTNEIQVMARLHHPNIAEVLDIGFEKGWPFYTMEYFCNDLGMLIGEKFVVEESSRCVPPHQALYYGRQILAGLEYMHDAGILHRDIKPFNMMLTNRGIVKICDFGMSRFASGEEVDMAGMNIGSPYYTAPEQIRDIDQADERADLYSAAVLIYRLLTGVLPSMADFMLSRVDPLYDQSWDSFFAKALSWNPDLRFQNALEMTDGLKKLELHWEKKRQKTFQGPRRQPGSFDAIPLRSQPVRVSGKKAMETFMVDRYWQPHIAGISMFKPTGSKTVVDESTGLVWQQTPSDYPLDRISADIFVETLNEIGFQGIRSWRLPTVNELLSLVRRNDDFPEKQGAKTMEEADSDWFWSCDRRSSDTSWYVNCSVGYTGWQNDSCLYLVRAVASQSAPHRA